MPDVLLSELTNDDIEWLVGTGQRRSLPVGSSFEPEPDVLYLLLDGELTTSIRPSSGASLDSDAKVATMTFSTGDAVGGEWLFGVPVVQRTFDVVQPAQLLGLPVSVLTDHMRQSGAFAAHLYRAIALLLSDQIRRLYNMPGQIHGEERQAVRDALVVFGELRDSDLDWLVSMGQVASCQPGDFLLQAGRPVDALHIILDGAFSVAVLEGNINPLAVCFKCPIETASTMTVVNTLSKGEIAGAIAFLDFRPLPVTIRATRESLVLNIPRQVFTLKLQQDLGFASRFYRILGTQLASMMQAALDGSAAESPDAQSSDSALEDWSGGIDELDLDALQKITSGANRFNWMLSRLGVGVA